MAGRGLSCFPPLVQYARSNWEIPKPQQMAKRDSRVRKYQVFQAWFRATSDDPGNVKLRRNGTTRLALRTEPCHIIVVRVECRLPPKLDSASFRGGETSIDAFDDERFLCSLARPVIAPGSLR